jgi:hypothetical protein
MTLMRSWIQPPPQIDIPTRAMYSYKIAHTVKTFFVSTKIYAPHMSKTFSVMTYNVHSCIGMGGQISPLRIAEVIDRYHPDVFPSCSPSAGSIPEERR